MYVLHSSPGTTTIDLTISGFCARDEAVVMCEELYHHVRRLGAPTNSHNILCDMSEGLVAPGETIAAIVHVMQEPRYDHLRARRIVFFTPSVLLRLQLGRIAAARPGVASFEDRASAVAWLALPDELPMRMSDLRFDVATQL